MDYEQEVTRLLVKQEALKQESAAKTAEIHDLKAELFEARQAAEKDTRTLEHLRHTIDVLERTIIGQAMVTGMVMRAIEDEADED